MAGPIYFGFGTGKTSVDQETAGLKFSDEDNGTRYSIGFRTLQFLGFEGTYDSLGSFSDENAGVRAEADISSYGVYALGVLPIGKHFEMFGKVGMHHWSVDSSLSGGVTESSSDSGNSSAYGTGMIFLLTKHIAIRTEYEKFKTDKTDSLSLTSLGVEIRF
jgi:opacity protein-like surface antigen